LLQYTIDVDTKVLSPLNVIVNVRAGSVSFLIHVLW